MPARHSPTSALGDLIRAQRQMANLSLRQLSAIAKVSNPYLSQVERGVHQPSLRVLRGIAEALDVSAESLLVQAGLLSDVTVPDRGATTAVIMADPRLTPAQRRALVGVYRSYVETDQPETDHPETHHPETHHDETQHADAPLADPPGTARPRPTRRTSA